MQALLDWIATLGTGTLYGILLVAATIENLFPPFPSDTVVAFGAFLAARGQGSAGAAFFFTWLGNVSGAMIVFGLGRRYGAERLERRLGGRHAEQRDARLRALFARYGIAAVFVSRFVPGVRAIVPVLAGALRLNVIWTCTMIATASALWYGVITLVAFRVGADWAAVQRLMREYSTFAAIAGAVVLVVGVMVWLVVRKRRRASNV